jgi:acyl-CoA oxidase
MELINEIRPQAIALTDAFNFSDYVVNSPLGCYDGDVYRRYFEITTRQNPTNRPHPYFERVLSLLNRS